jgi:hypothetical protein
MNLSSEQPDLQTYLTASTPKPLLEGGELLGQLSEVLRLMMKAFFGDKATAKTAGALTGCRSGTKVTTFCSISR